MEKGRPGRKIRGGILAAAVIALFLSNVPEAAPADLPASATLQGACDIAFLATSTLHDVSGTARCRPFTVRIARDASGKEVIPVVEVEVPVAGMDTRNGSRDGKMREMFRSGKFPRILGTAHDVDAGRLRTEMEKERGGKVPLDLVLRIRETERKIRAVASNLQMSGDRVAFDIEFPVSLGEFDLTPPSVLGIIRVGDKVTVKAGFTLTVSRNP